MRKTANLINQISLTTLEHVKVTIYSTGSLTHEYINFKNYEQILKVFFEIFIKYKVQLTIK